MKRFWCVLLTCVLAFCCVFPPVYATEIPENNTVIFRASGRINYSITGKTAIYLGDDFYLYKNDVISYNCTYVPNSASVDFGYVTSDNVFHYLNCTSGNFDESFSVAKTGKYTLAIRNNEDYAVTVTGTVWY